MGPFNEKKHIEYLENKTKQMLDLLFKEYKKGALCAP